MAILFFIPILFFIFFFFVVLKINSAHRAVIRTIANQNAGSVQSYRSHETAFFKRKNIAFRASHVKRKGKPFLKLLAPLPASNFRLKIFEELVDPKLKKFLGMQDIIIGSQEFDDRYVIQSNSTDELQRILTFEVQDSILRLGRKIEISVLRGQFLCHVHCPNPKLADGLLEKAIAVFFAILEAFEHPLEPAMLDLNFVEPESVTCMVCGDVIKPDLQVNCKACKTPHHEDCWKYLGMCSTYACGHKKFESKGKKPKLWIGSVVFFLDALSCLGGIS